ncbi:MAG: hypothetical protein J6Y28_09665 [Acholeplasmatales bacterium]|nr:hypothetical protein [Methanobrevibacter sp.]MBP5446425.1 hypothetical protein [Acholeplasmatales bacterium]
MNITPNTPTQKAGGNTSSPEVKVPAGTTNNTTISNDELNSEYIDKRSVTISLVHNYSNYRRVNLKVLGQRKETIGSSVKSCQILSSNAEEVAAYFPALIGLSPTNPDFITRVKAWLSNIQFTINENDVSLDTTFIYKHKADYLKIQEEEDRINKEYDKVDRANTAAIKEALKIKIDALNTLESSKYKYGHPAKLEDYLMYRHCLLYSDVAKDIALINSDPTLRFYIKDEAREAEKQKKLTEQKTKAMKNFVELNGTEAKFNAVYVAMCVFRNDNLSEALLKSRNEKVAALIDFVNTNPDKFNRFVEDKNVQLKAFIETLIVRGELVRSEFNQQISTAEGTFIGSNMNEAIAWFENEEHKDVREAYENKIKLF